MDDGVKSLGIARQTRRWWSARYCKRATFNSVLDNRFFSGSGVTRTMTRSTSFFLPTNVWFCDALRQSPNLTFQCERTNWRTSSTSIGRLSKRGIFSSSCLSSNESTTNSRMRINWEYLAQSIISQMIACSAKDNVGQQQQVSFSSIVWIRWCLSVRWSRCPSLERNPICWSIPKVEMVRYSSSSVPDCLNANFSWSMSRLSTSETTFHFASIWTIWIGRALSSISNEEFGASPTNPIWCNRCWNLQSFLGQSSLSFQSIDSRFNQANKSPLNRPYLIFFFFPMPFDVSRPLIALRSKRRPTRPSLSISFNSISEQSDQKRRVHGITRSHRRSSLRISKMDSQRNHSDALNLLDHRSYRLVGACGLCWL